MAKIPGIGGLLFDTGGVLYHRPREDRHLEVFLMQHGLRLRNRAVVDKGVRAAVFDVRTGRIPLDTFYDAILRLHGVEDQALFEDGRTALYRDAADIDLFPGVIETLDKLRAAGYQLGTISDTGHSAGEKTAWLAASGIPPGLWAAMVVSSDCGMLKTEARPFEIALAQMDLAPREAAFVGHASHELATASEMGLVTVAFLPDNPGVEADYRVHSFYGLGDLFLD